MPDSLVIRPMADSDLGEVLRIQAACYTAIVPESPASMDAKRRAAPATCFVACAGERVLGYLLALPVAYPRLPALDATDADVPADADTLYLHDLALSPAARGTGAGAALVQAALAQGRRAGWPRACLVAIQGSAPYWQRFGFRALAEVPLAARAKLVSYGDAQLMAMAL